MLHLSISLRALVFAILLAAVAVTGSDVAHGAPSAINLTADNQLNFTSPGQNTAHDITVDNNDGALRFFACPTLTITPECAAIQFYGNDANVFGGQLFLDSGASANAALIFRTAGAGQAVGERMRINASGNVKIGSPTASGCVNNGLCVQSSIATDSSMNASGHVRSLNGTVQSGSPSSLLCNSAGDICADDDVVVDDDVHVVGQVRVGTLTAPCSGDGNVCAAADIIAEGRVKTGTVDASCSINSSICAGGALVADEFVTAGLTIGSCATGQVCASDRMLAGSVSSANCADAGDNCAGDDLVSDEDVIVGSGCVRDGSLAQIIGTCTSDARLKMNIQPLHRLLTELVALQPVTFDWRRDEFPELQLGMDGELGLIAQDVEAVMPDLVTVKADGFKAVHYERLPLLMLQGIRELKAENDSLRDELVAERQRNDGLEARLAALEQRLNGTALLVAAR
jgi:hypothetical protein